LQVICLNAFQFSFKQLEANIEVLDRTDFKWKDIDNQENENFAAMKVFSVYAVEEICMSAEDEMKVAKLFQFSLKPFSSSSGDTIKVCYESIHCIIITHAIAISDQCIHWRSAFICILWALLSDLPSVSYDSFSFILLHLILLVGLCRNLRSLDSRCLIRGVRLSNLRSNKYPCR
jgi:hypothetical protein